VWAIKFSVANRFGNSRDVACERPILRERRRQFPNNCVGALDSNAAFQRPPMFERFGTRQEFNGDQVLGEINDRIASRLEALGFTLPPSSQRCPHFVGARLPQGLTGDLVGSLRAKHVFISQRGSSIRVAPHLHVTEPDLEQLLAALDVAVASSTPPR